MKFCDLENVYCVQVCLSAAVISTFNGIALPLLEEVMKGPHNSRSARQDNTLFVIPASTTEALAPGARRRFQSCRYVG